jgi:hypothetical protein
MKGLRFRVPLVRFVIPLDSLKSQPLVMHNSASLRPQTVLRIIRIEKPLEALLPKPKASAEATAPCTEPIAPAQARKKKANPSGTRRRKASAPRKKK